MVGGGLVSEVVNMCKHQIAVVTSASLSLGLPSDLLQPGI
jgi:hypothetical protein